MPEIFGAALMGGGSGPAYAAISAKYPDGATCTCALGSKTFTAPDTSGQALFIVPTAGDWVVTISQSGKKPVSQTVPITVEGQAVSITVSFDLVLYDAGSLLGGSITAIAIDGGVGSTPVVPSIYSQTPSLNYGFSSGVDAEAFGAVDITFPIDLTDYKTMYVKFSCTQINSAAAGYMQFRLAKDYNNPLASSIYVHNTSVKEDAILSLDIESLSGQYYWTAICFKPPLNVSVFKIWFE